MKLWLKLSFAALAAFMIVGSLYATGRIGTYRVGRDIDELGLEFNDDNKYEEFDPDVFNSNGRYYGEIRLLPSTEVGIAIVLEVEANRIVSVSRQFYVD
jgi:hypothetical protein